MPTSVRNSRSPGLPPSGSSHKAVKSPLLSTNPETHRLFLTQTYERGRTASNPPDDAERLKKFMSFFKKISCATRMR